MGLGIGIRRTGMIDIGRIDVGRIDVGRIGVGRIGIGRIGVGRSAIRCLRNVEEGRSVGAHRMLRSWDSVTHRRMRNGSSVARMVRILRACILAWTIGVWIRAAIA